MASLTAAHRGYEYQDLLVASRFVDMLLGSVVHVRVEEKLVPDDRFDDLTTVDVVGKRERTQFKHTDNCDLPLTLSTFTTDSRRLRLDRVIASMLADRSGPGSGARALSFRIVVRDTAPTDPKLTAVLTVLERDPGPFLPVMTTARLGFDAVALWSQREPRSESASREPFGFLFRADTSLTFDDLAWACDHLAVEVGAPPASGDLTTPDVAELLLLTRVRSEVGAETFPNLDRMAIDVAAAMISTARAARQGRVVATTEELLRRAQLRSDFGAVSRAHPVDRALEVLRPSTSRQLMELASELGNTGGHLLVVGPPGHGKSWICQQLLEALCDAGWLIAEHYCYLGDADGERLQRALTEAVFGSLVGRLAEADPRLVMEQRPRFAADEDALLGCIRRSLEFEPTRRIAIVIDGLDHITRVRASGGDRFDPSRSLAEALASLDLQPGAVAIVLSQPGQHLEPLENAGAKSIKIPGLDEHELERLAAQLNVIPDDERVPSPLGSPLLQDTAAITDFLHVLAERSAGNALYATYLCRETLRRADGFMEPTTTVRSLPPFDGTLKNYYDHIYQTLGPEAGWIADVIALVDFSITRAELRQIRPDAAHRVDGALAVLGPVLIERATQGGVRVYHESFARYLRGPFQHDTAALRAMLARIADWLDAKGLLADPRAFRSLLPILSEAGRDRRVIDLVDQTFVARAVAAGFPSSGISANLAVAIGSAARLHDWPIVVRYVELSRAAESYQSERFDSTLVAFADVPATLLGADTLAARLVDDDRLVMPARAGLQMCAAIDALGATAPWRPYMTGYLREMTVDNTSYGEASDRAVSIAWLRGRLRLAATHHRINPGDRWTSAETESEPVISDGDNAIQGWDFIAPINWSRLAAWMEKLDLPACEVITAVADTYGLKGVVRLLHSLRSPGDACLALAERLACKPAPDSGIGSPRMWATAAVAHGLTAGSAHRLLRLGLDPAHLDYDSYAVARERLFDLTRRIQEPSVRWQNAHVGAWLDACALTARRDQLAMNAAEALIAGDGWYRCWLRFAHALSRAEAADLANRGSLALDALRLLADDLNPFSGDPRACDLFSLHETIQDTIGRAMCLLDEQQWELGLNILKDVSASVTTTLSGELGGPVPPGFLLRVAVDGTSSTRRRIAEALVQAEIAKGSSGRFYADLAEYRLLAARLALAAKDTSRAEALWREACTFLTAYGWHKDITIFEVLDPLPVLIKSDPARGRLRVAAAQGLCERIPLHTDGKETRHARSQWWELLAKADPVAMVRLAVPQLLGHCNDPNHRLHAALEHVWQEWHERVDPLLSAALRLTLDTPLNEEDFKQLERLANDVSSDKRPVRHMMTWLLARADECPVAYPYSNSAEQIAKDDDAIAQLNKIATRVDLAPVVVVREDDASTTNRSQWRGPGRKGESPASVRSDDVHAAFPPSMPGLAKAIRAWRRLPYDARSPEVTLERFSNAIGYRLIELVAAGRHHEAEEALRSLAEGADLGRQAGILRSLAEGLERHGETRLASVAYTLTWLRTRGHGGWLIFGGKTQIDALQRASALDCSIAFVVVAQEIQRIVTNTHWSYGISQALIHAFAVGALTCTGRSTIDMAFAAWDEAFSVISARAPRVDASDDADHPYNPPDPDFGECAPGELETAIALAALGGLAHPARENKRRALLAAQLLLGERAAIAGPAFDTALRVTSDPATLTWILRLIESSGERSAPVRAACQHSLRELVSRGLITVRALARRLIIGDAPPLAAPTQPEVALLDGGERVLWVPAMTGGLIPDELASLDRELDSAAGIRLRRGERFLPALRAAVRARVATSLRNETTKQRLNSQLDAFADRTRKLWPDAFLVPEETIEEALQYAAAGGRAALLMAGNPTTNPIAWEDDVASALLDDPIVPLSVEALRQPRPSIAPPPASGHDVWPHIRERLLGGTSSLVEEASEKDGLIFATLTIEPVRATPIVKGGTFEGWRWLATMERRSVKPSDRQRSADLVVRRYRVLEVREVHDRQALALPPVSAGDLRWWRIEADPDLESPLLDSSQPLIGVDDELTMVGDGRRGLGVPESLLVPGASLIALLNLHPGAPWIYEDRAGLALALVTWRGEYDTSDYYLAWPRTTGSGIVIRPDLLGRLIDAAGEHRLVLRDFVVGDLESLSTKAAPTPSGP